LAIKAPGFGDRRKEMLEDIAILPVEQLFQKILAENLIVSLLMIVDEQIKYGLIKKIHELSVEKVIKKLQSTNCTN
jgi:chaperonin GroEL (HSP60 family)